MRECALKEGEDELEWTGVKISQSAHCLCGMAGNRQFVCCIGLLLYSESEERAVDGRNRKTREARECLNDGSR